MGLAEKTFKKGEIIIKEGDVGKTLFFINEGKAGVYVDYGKKNPFRLGFVEAGEFFGEMAILEAYPRSATVVAERNISVIEIPGDDMNSFFSENPDQIIALMKLLGSRIETMAADYVESQVLLKQLRDADEGKKKSLFSKIKKHMDTYQANKNQLDEPSREGLKAELEKYKDVSAGELKTLRKGMFIFREGKEEQCMYILHSGKVAMYNNYRSKEEVMLSELEAVSFFGEMGIISDEPRNATAVVESNGATVEAISREDLQTMIHKCPNKVYMILRDMSYRLRKLNVDFLKTCKEITD
ncbi:MAG: cyclic nucleotide-binding domain-containing protein, partial [Saccharofermentans sp.]|nr:cyclic nucleotide-binding domain-containing protein [Saccharofermentans sp.]